MSELKPPSSLPSPQPAVPDLDDPYAILRYPNVGLFLGGRLATVLGEQMLNVAVAWNLYERTGSATVLGLIGLIQLIPVVLLALPAGHIADSFDRRRVILLCQAIMLSCGAGLAFVAVLPNQTLAECVPTLLNEPTRWLAESLGETASPTGEPTNFADPALTPMLALVLTLWTARTFSNAARGPLLAALVPATLYPRATAWNSGVFQIAAVTGPALGGFCLAWLGPAATCAAGALGMTVWWGAVFCMSFAAPPRRAEPVTLTGLLAGLRFVLSARLMLAAITLDLFAVLLGGATALLPIFADRLAVGPVGLGWLQAAPAVGALVMSFFLAHRPPMQQAGASLLWAVVGFGLATLGFGLSESFAFSLAMLFLVGATDAVSVVVRDTLVQALTPDQLRGRVSAINNVFIGTSNQLGAFESGVTAAMFGPVVSVAAGGIGTILVVAVAAVVWPEIRRLGSLEQLQPLPVPDQNEPKSN